MFQPHEKHIKNIPSPKKGEIFLNNFLGGIAWGTGSILGIFIAAAILGFLIEKTGNIPLFGNIIAEIIESVRSQLLH